MKGSPLRMGLFARCFRQMRRDPWLQGAALLSLTISLAILGSYLTLCINLEKAFQRVGTGSTLVAVVSPRVTPDLGRALAIRMAARGDVKRAEYITESEALARFRGQLGKNADILDGLDTNPLPATVEVFLEPRADEEFMIQELENTGMVEDVITAQPWLRQLEEAANVARELAAALGLLLFLGVVFLVLNTVRMAVYVRREQLEVMEMVGASNWFIRAPFIIEAALQAVAASVAASVIVWGLLGVFSRHQVLPLGFDLAGFLEFPWQTPFILLFLAIMAAFTGGMLGVTRGLKPKVP